MPAETPIAIRAERVRFSSSGRRVTAPVSFEAPEGALVAVLGGSGSGKTPLLLALAGRMRGWNGSAIVLGHDAAREAGRVRGLVGVGLIAGVNDLAEPLTAAQHVAEQRLFVPRRERSPHGDVLARVGLAGAERTRVRDLDAEQRVRLGIALALVRDVRVLVVDDLDCNMDSEQRLRVLALLRELTAEGLTVLTGCVDRETAEHTDLVVELHLGSVGRIPAQPAPEPAAETEERADAVA